MTIYFPTNKIFYPLIPSSAAVGQPIQESIYVVGLQHPELYEAIQAGSTIRYHVSDDDVHFVGRHPFVYTVLKLDVPAATLTQDIWFDQHTNLRTAINATLAQLSMSEAASLAIFLAWLVLLSSLSGLLAGALIFSDRSRSALARYARLGLWNLLTIVGLTIALALFKPAQPTSAWRKVAFWFVFSCVLIGMSIAMTLGAVLLMRGDIDPYFFM